MDTHEYRSRSTCTCENESSNIVSRETLILMCWLRAFDCGGKPRKNMMIDRARVSEREGGREGGREGEGGRERNSQHRGF